MTSVFLVGGARPNFMKLAPLYHAFRRRPEFQISIVDTGQHYDDSMAGAFFRDLDLPAPAISLSVGSASHAVQTARILERFEGVLLRERPDVVVVVGDVNSTLACALVASKVVYPNGRRPLIVHVEAGLRSFDRAMPEEINRILTDAISDVLFVSEPSGMENLRREGRDGAGAFLVGNVMIDTLLARARDARRRERWSAFGLDPLEYVVVTLHRPSNVDDDTQLGATFEAIKAVSRRLPVVFPVHPRTRSRLQGLPLASDHRITLCEPQSYLDFLSLVIGSRVVLTDSGGIQEETTIVGIPCLTLRANTERPITVELGTNRLIGTDPSAIIAAIEDVLSSPMPAVPKVPLWDGRAAERIADRIAEVMSSRPNLSDQQCTQPERG